MTKEEIRQLAVELWKQMNTMQPTRSDLKRIAEMTPEERRELSRANRRAK